MSAPRVQRLGWDSGHFEMPTGIVGADVSTPDGLRQALGSAESDGLRLVYWLSTDVFIPDADMLARFGGRRIVGHRRYRRPITNLDRRRAADPCCESLSGESPAPDVVDLAMTAGRYSRFRLDTRLPVDRFEAMYQTWITRSLSRELADDVLVLRDKDRHIRSLVSYRVHDDTAQVGLISTGRWARRQGSGAAVLAEAHRRIGQSGLGSVVVSTQTENHAACRLFEKSGYSIVFQGSHYHFLMA